VVGTKPDLVAAIDRLAALKYIDAKQAQVVQEIDENPILGELVTVTAIDVNDTHLCWQVGGW
jgi:hypothetical protein